MLQSKPVQEYPFSNGSDVSFSEWYAIPQPKNADELVFIIDTVPVQGLVAGYTIFQSVDDGRLFLYYKGDWYKSDVFPQD